MKQLILQKSNDNDDSMLSFLASRKSHSHDDAHKVLAANTGIAKSPPQKPTNNSNNMNDTIRDQVA
jgi:hypothetical protein